MKHEKIKLMVHILQLEIMNLTKEIDDKKMILLIFSYSLYTASTNPKFELGFMFGDPSAISTKWWSGSRSAFDFAAGWSFPHNGKLSIQGDYLLH